jgi:hypothetical protein
MRYLRWVGLVPSLLIGGLIVAPVHSEAASITIQSGTGSPVVYGGSVSIPVATTSSCSSEETTAGYTRCFALTPGTYAGVTVANAPSATAKVLVADTTGAGGKLDLLTLSGVKFTPGVNKTVKVNLTHTLNTAPNPAGTYSYALRLGGYFSAGDGSNLNNFVKLSGVGNFGGTQTAVAIGNPVSATVGSPATATTSFSLQQSPTYPSSSCNTGSGCSPTMVHTVTFTVIGSDSVVFTKSADGAGSACNLNPQGPPGGNPARPCHGNQNSIENGISAFFAQQDNADTLAFTAAGATPFVPCTVDCTPDPDLTVPGTITINKDICNSYYSCSELAPETFNFIITGPTSATAMVQTGSNGVGQVTVGGLIPGMYTVSELARVDWSLTTSSNACGQGASVEVPENGNGVCTFVNRFHGD